MQSLLRLHILRGIAQSEYWEKFLIRRAEVEKNSEAIFGAIHTSTMPLFGFLGPISETHILNNTRYNIFANVKMSSKIDVSLNGGNKTFSAGVGKKDLSTPPGFSKIVPGQTQKFSPEGSGRRILEVCTAYLSIYIQMPDGTWQLCCENHHFKENRNFTVNSDLSFAQNHYDEDWKMH